MANIQANKQGRIQQARKRLKKHISDLKDAGSLTATQRDILFANVLLDLTRIQLFQLGRLEDID